MEKKGHSNKDNEQGLIEKVVKIDRVNKVVKGGKRLAFRSLVIVGDGKGQVGIATGKSKEVPAAIKKGIENAKKHLKSITIINGTIPHQIIGKFGASSVVLRPAKPGTGVIAGGAVRILLEVLGLTDIVAKQIGSSNANNVALAALDGLLKLKTVEDMAKRKTTKVNQVNTSTVNSTIVKKEEIKN